MKIKQTDMASRPDLSHSSGTGATAHQKPIYQSYLPPCNGVCPAGENIQAWLAFVAKGEYYEAWQELVKNNPLPAVHGRVCYHPCETHCNRDKVDESVSIHSVERFLGDLALEKGWTPKVIKPATGKKILVVGAGPSGLSAAYHLARLGHEVEIRDAGPVAGGMIHFGIPAYRMPRDVLQNEIKNIENIGVKFTLNHKVDDLLAEKEAGGFDAAFVAVGAHISKRVDIPTNEAGKIMDAVSFLADSADPTDKPLLGRKVAVYGGGNTAMDAARTATRLGASDTMIIYRRDRESMPAHSFEADEALEEGVKINWLRTIKSIDNGEIKIEKMKLNEQGIPEPTGEFETLAADHLILALGQNIDSALLENAPDIQLKKDGTVVINDHMMTGCDGIFAGGDMVPSERTVTIATGHGKKAAFYIDAWLNNTTYSKAPKNPNADYEGLHLWFNTEAEQRHQPSIPVDKRANDFSEVVGGLTEKQAVFEAQRCYSCGNCFECDGCFGACPEGAITKLGKGLGYEIDYDKCTGCSACVDQCPCHAMDMIEMISTANAKKENGNV